MATSIGAPSLGAMPSRQEEPRAQREHQRGEPDDREVRRAPPAPARGRPPRERPRVDRPGDERQERERVVREDAPPRPASPQDAQDQPRGEKRESERQGAIRQPVERLEVGQPVVERAGTLRLQLALLEHVHHGTGEVQDERRDPDEDQPDVHPDPCTAEGTLDPGDTERTCRRRVEAEHEDDGQDERAQTLTPYCRSTQSAHSTATHTATDTASLRLPSGGRPSRKARARSATAWRTQPAIVATDASRWSHSSRWTR